MTEFYPYDEEAVDHTTLWRDIGQLFQENAFELGIQYEPRKHFLNLVLVSENFEGTEEYVEPYRLELWGRWMSGQGIVRALIKYIKSETDIVDYIYRVTPNDASELKGWFKTALPLDYREISDIRDDLYDADWSPEVSVSTAETVPFAKD